MEANSIFSKVNYNEDGTIDLESSILKTLPRPQRTYKDYDVSKLSEEVRDFYDMVNEAGAQYGFAIRVVDGIENDAEGMFDGNGNILLDGNKMIDEATISRVIGHEGYHYLKGTEQHKYIIDLALQGKDRSAEIIRKYKQYANAGVELRTEDGKIDTAAVLDEIGAEFMQDILSDPQVAERIWDSNPTLAERIIRFFEDIIARLQGKAMSDTNRKALEAYQQGLRNMQQRSRSENGTRYALGRTTDGKPVVKIETDIFANIGSDDKKHEVMANYIKEHIGEVYTIIESGQKVYIGEDLPGEFTHSKSTQRMKNKKQWGKLDAKNQAFQNVGELIEIATNRDWKKNEKEKHKVDAKYGWYHYDTRFALPNGDVYTAELLIRNDANGKKYLYDLIKIKEDNSVLASTRNGSAIRAEQSALGDSNYLLSEDILPQNQQESNTQKRFSVDTSGRELTAEQADYFKNSKVRDENGNLIVMYHGSPNAGFTEFRSGTYFTPMKWYADGYKKQGASMLSYKKTANNPDTYEVYLNIEKPFDTRNPKERRIFEQEYYGQWGSGAPLADSGLPDWTDGMDLQEFIEEKGYDYDGLILDEGAVGGYGEEVKSRGLSYVVFSPEQVKNVDNQNPTSNKDIRYSMDAVGSQEYKDLLDENGAIPAGENPTGENYRVEVPNKAMDGKKVRQFVRTIMESPTVDDTVANMFAQELIDPEQVLSGVLTMESTGNKTLVDTANKAINDKGWQQNYKDLHSRMTTGDKITAQDIAVATRVVQEAQKAGDAHAAFDLLTDLTVVSSELGQGLQAVQILKRLSPEGQLMSLIKTQKRINDNLRKQKRKTVSTISEETATEFLQARSNAKRDEIWNREITRMAHETQGAWADKLNAIRYACMLSNPKTHIRNIIGNFVMQAAYVPRNIISGGLQDIKGGEKTHSFVGAFINTTGDSRKELREFANYDYHQEAEQVLRNIGNRYDDVSGQFASQQKVFGDSLPGRALEQVAGKGKYSVGSVLDAGDIASSLMSNVLIHIF